MDHDPQFTQNPFSGSQRFDLRHCPLCDVYAFKPKGQDWVHVCETYDDRYALVRGRASNWRPVPQSVNASR